MCPFILHLLQLLRNLNKKKRRSQSCCQDHKLKTLVSENCAKGCSIMFNAEARKLLMRTPENRITWHDWWCLSVIACLGTVLSTEEELVNYRIHEGNLIGNPSSFKKLQNFFARPSGLVVNQFKLLLFYYDREIHEIERHVIEDYLNIFTLPFHMRILRLLFDVKRRKKRLQDMARRISWLLKKP